MAVNRAAGKRGGRRTAAPLSSRTWLGPMGSATDSRDPGWMTRFCQAQEWVAAVSMVQAPEDGYFLGDHIEGAGHVLDPYLGGDCGGGTQRKMCHPAPL